MHFSNICYHFVVSVYSNPLPPEFLFFVVFRDIGSFRLPTHSRNAHRIFFDDLFLKIKIEIFAKWCHMGKLGGKGLNG